MSPGRAPPGEARYDRDVPRSSRTARSQGAGVAPRDRRAPRGPRAGRPDRCWVTDDELAELALADACDDQVPEDAVPLRLGDHDGLLAPWYMPAVGTTRVSGWRTPVVLTIVLTLVVLEALGLCSVFGQVVVG